MFSDISVTENLLAVRAVEFDLIEGVFFNPAQLVGVPWFWTINRAARVVFLNTFDTVFAKEVFTLVALFGVVDNKLADGTYKIFVYSVDRISEEVTRPIAHRAPVQVDEVRASNYLSLRRVYHLKYFMCIFVIKYFRCHFK